jgi:hypothetical protein
VVEEQFPALLRSCVLAGEKTANLKGENNQRPRRCGWEYLYIDVDIVAVLLEDLLSLHSLDERLMEMERVTFVSLARVDRQKAFANPVFVVALQDVRVQLGEDLGNHCDYSAPPHLPP